MLTIITPIYLDPKKKYTIERFAFFLQNAYCNSEIERIIVDHGSPRQLMAKFVKIAKEKNIKIINLHREGHPFSAGACRNSGAQAATNPYITFQDIDLIAPPSTYEQILKRVKKISYFNELEIIPCLYLKKEASIGYIENDINEAHTAIFQQYLKGRNESIQFFAPATSMIITRRDYYLSLGGNRTEFFGHGYEDFESLNRLACLSSKFVRSHDYYNHDYSYTSAEYKGYRTFYAMFGRQLMQESIFFVHLWHPTGDNRSYEERNKKNKTLFEGFIRAFDQKSELPAPIGLELPGREHTLVLAPQNGKTAGSIRYAVPFLGKCTFIDEKSIDSDSKFIEIIKENKISQVLFFNQYGNEKRLGLYAACQIEGIKTISFDRGALPDSWFFDFNGFNARSSSYNHENWNKPYPHNDLLETEEYIHDILNSEKTLEKNGSRIGEASLRKKYNLGNKKVIFVPLQRPNDTVVKYFSDKISSIEHFCSCIDELAQELPADWVVLVKNHPLEQEMPEMKHVQIVEPDTHFYDLLATAEVTLLLNSGVGIFSLLFGNATYCVGESFYTQPGLAEKIEYPQDLIKKINNIKQPDYQSVLRYITYLRNDFYSFGETEYIEIKHEKSITTAASKINFRQIIIGEIKETLQFRKEIEFTRSSPLFDIYRRANLDDKASTTEKNSTKEIANPSDNRTKIVAAINIEKTASPLENQNLVGRLIVRPLIENKRTIIRRKFRKLLISPKAFFYDAIKNRIK